MAAGGNWLDELEARLDATLEGFLRSNPQQEALMAEQEARERQQQLRRERVALKADAERQRQSLLRLAEDIRRWQERVERAKGAGALELAGRAEAHIATLMEQGRARWRTLEELGERYAAVGTELEDLKVGQRPVTTGVGTTKPGPSPEGRDLDADWAAFELGQELEDLRRKGTA